jgi:hypothetical protein
VIGGRGSTFAASPGYNADNDDDDRTDDNVSNDGDGTTGNDLDYDGDDIDDDCDGATGNEVNDDGSVNAQASSPSS